jgi:hypothetical protein
MHGLDGNARVCERSVEYPDSLADPSGRGGSRLDVLGDVTSSRGRRSERGQQEASPRTDVHRGGRCRGFYSVGHVDCEAFGFVEAPLVQQHPGIRALRCGVQELIVSGGRNGHSPLGYGGLIRPR